MENICSACLNINITKLIIELPFFRHLDFKTVSKKPSLFKCSECQTVSNPSAVKIETPTFKTKQYADSQQTEQTINVEGFSEPVTRSFLQVKTLTDRFIKNEDARILDIGCFDGRLLRGFDGILRNADLWGFDINPHLQSLFPKNNNFHFCSTKLKDVPGKFDLITVSHSILYIPDTKEFMTSIIHLLKDNGLLFIQIPDIRKNPYYSLMGDQSLIFTETSMKNVLGKYGYKGDVISTEYFPRELLLISHRVESGDFSSFKEDCLFEENIEKINRVKKALNNIIYDNLTLLGTTVNAAFVDEIMGECIQFFVDENPSKVGEVFRGKDVISPHDLRVNNHILLPYGKSGLKIKERFESLYKGTFTVI